MDTNSNQNPPANGSKKNKRKRRLSRAEKRALKQNGLQNMNQMNAKLEVSDGKICTITNGGLQHNLLELDYNAQLLTDQPKIDIRSTEILTEETVGRKKRRNRKSKKKAKNKDEVQIVDQSDLMSSLKVLGVDHGPGNDSELNKNDSTAMESECPGTTEHRPQHQDHGMNHSSASSLNMVHEIVNPANLGKHNETTLSPVGVVVSISESYSDFVKRSELWEMDVEPCSCESQHGLDTRSTENHAEGTVEGKKKRKRKIRKKAKNKDKCQIVDQSNIMSNLKLSDVDQGSGNDSKLNKNETTLSPVEAGVSIPKTYSDFVEGSEPNEMDVEPFSCESQHTLDTRSTENLAEGTGERKKRRKRKARKKAKNKDQSQIVDQSDIMSSLKLSDVDHGPGNDSKLNESETALSLADVDGSSCKTHSDFVERSEQREMDGEHFSCENQHRLDTRSSENLADGTGERKRKRKRKTRKRAKNKDEFEIVDQSDIMSRLQLSDVDHGPRDDSRLNINDNNAQESEFPATTEPMSHHHDHDMNHSSASSLYLVHGKMNPVCLGKQNETALSPVEVEGSSCKSYSNLDERSEPLGKAREMEVEVFSCESQHKPLSIEMSGKNEKKIKNESNEEEIIVYRGKDSAACSSCTVEVTKHLSPSILKASNCSPKDLCLHPKIAPIPFVRRKLLVLDLNGLLADIVMPAPKDCTADTRIWGRAIFRRPFCDDFLKFCFEKFDVAIWSSRSRNIIEKVVNYLLGDLKNKLLFCWDMSHSTQTGYRTLENVHKPLVMKELKKIWEKDGPGLPWVKGDYDEANTLLLDDSPYKALLNPLHTAVFPYSYHYKDKSDKSLGPGGDLRVYLEDMLMCDNVQKYVEQHPFGQSAIDEKNLFWSFYSEVLQSMSAQPI